MWVTITGLPSRVLAVFDGGAEIALMSSKLYASLEPRPELRKSSERIRGLYGPDHSPKGECTIQIQLTDLGVVMEYDVIVDEMDEDLIVDAAMMQHAGIQLKYETKELTRKDRTVKAVTRVSRRENKARRVVLQKDWVLQPNSRQIVAGQVQKVGEQSSQIWIVEPAKLLSQKHSVLVAKSLCQHGQVLKTVPVEIYNPTDEAVQLFKNTTLGVMSPLDEILEVQIGTSQETSRTIGQVKKQQTVESRFPDDLEKMIQDSSQVLNVQQMREYRQLVTEYRDVFSTKNEPLGRTEVVQHEIKTTASPIKQPYRRIPVGLRQEAIDEEERMKDLGVIEPSESPWAAPVVLVRKKDGTLRYCIDYRKLNEITQKDSYPLPNMQDCLDSLDGAQFFSSMDLSSGYWQVQLTEDAKDKTSFYGAGGGLWRFKVMPFGLCNAPATFERLMEKVLGQLQWQILLCYLDDILIFSKSVEQHFEHLKTVFERLRTAKLKLKPKKCHFFCQQVTFLGHVVSRDGVSTDPDKIQKVRDCPSPTDLHEVRSVVGLMSYYRRFMPHFSEVAKPLIKLTEKDQDFRWQDEQERAFQQMKELLITAPVLAHPRTEGLFVLDTDASNEGIGAVLSQIQDDQEKVIAYASKTLSKTEKNYCITRRELLAVVTFVTQYKHFLLGRKFLVRTDNAAVRYWMKIHSDTYDPQGQTARWMVKLSAYDFEIKHRPGKQHSNADGLSRAPFIRCAQCELRHEDAYRTKRTRTLTVVSQRDASTQTVGRKRGANEGIKCDRLQKRKREDEEASRPSSSKKGEKVEKEKQTVDGDRAGSGSGSTDSKWNAGSLASKARVMTRGQRQMPIGPKSQGTTPSWMEGGVCLDETTFKDEQFKDPASVDALCWLRQGKRPDREGILSAGLDQKFLWGNFDTLIVLDGLLCKRIGPLVDGTVKTTVYVPPSLRKEMIKQCHDTKTSGHFYYWKTLGKVKKYFTWGGINRDVQIYCKACEVCATRKTAGRHQKAEMKRYDVGLPMEEVAIDLKGPYPESEGGNKYVLVIVDSFSKWMEAYPLPNIEAKTVADKLVMEFISRFGVPIQIKTDRGRQFECALFKEMCDLLDVEHKMSTPFHPQGNSRVERMVKVVGNLIALFCQSYKEWDKNLPLLTLAYRSTVHEVTGFTPNYIMTGREVSLPLDVMLGSIRDRDDMTVPSYVERLKHRLQGCFEQVRQHLKQFGERQKRYYNLSRHGDQYQPGDLVYLREKTRKKQVSPKLMPRWKGPYVVVKRFGTVYEVMMNLKGSKLYHFDLLKPCHSQDIPAWIRKARKKIAAGQETVTELSGTTKSSGRPDQVNVRRLKVSNNVADQSGTRIVRKQPIDVERATRAHYIRGVATVTRPDQLAPELVQATQCAETVSQYFKVQDDIQGTSQDEKHSFTELSSQADDMALRGTEGRLYKWCVICRDEVPARHKTLRIHLNQAHEMELLSGCPRCNHYRSRWSDVKKHCKTHEVNLDDPNPGDECTWGLTKQDFSSAKPTYSLTTEICPYPLRGQRLTAEQIQIIAQAKILEPTSSEPAGQPGPSKVPLGGGKSHSTESRSFKLQTSKSQPSKSQSSRSQSSSRQSSKSQSHSREREQNREQIQSKEKKTKEVKRPRTRGPDKPAATSQPIVVDSDSRETVVRQPSLVTSITIGETGESSVERQALRLPTTVRFSPDTRKLWRELELSRTGGESPDPSLLSSIPSTPCSSTASSKISSRVRRIRATDSSSEEDETMLTVSSLERSGDTLDIPILNDPDPERSFSTPRRSRRIASASSSTPVARPLATAAGRDQTEEPVVASTEGAVFIDPGRWSPSTVVVPVFKDAAVQTDFHVEETDVLLAFKGRVG